MLWWTKRQLDSADASERVQAIRKLGGSRDSGALEPLVMSLGDSAEEVRKEALEALGKVDPNWRKSAPAQAGARTLIASLSHEEAADRERAAQALGAIRDARALQPLVDALRDRSASVRQAARTALDQIDPHWQNLACSRNLISNLIKMLADPSDSIREQAAEGLGLIGVSEAVEPLIAALSDSSGGVRSAAAKALGRSRDPRVVEPLTAILKDKEEHIRMGAADGLGSTRDPRALQPLIELLDDPSVWVRLSGVNALGNLGDPRGVEFLLAVLTGDQVLPCLAALGALEKLDAEWRRLEMTRNAVRKLEATLADEGKENWARLAAALVMSRIDPQWPRSEAASGSIPLLLGSLTGRFDEVHAALEVLKKIGPAVGRSPAAQGSVLKFTALLQHKDPRIRCAAAWVLGEVGNPKAIDPLRAMASSKDADLKKAAQESLRKLGAT